MKIIDAKAKALFDKLLGSLACSRFPYTLSGLELWLTDELRKTGVDYHTANKTAEAYLRNIILNQAFVIRLIGAA
jgi:hypothetical protein